MRKYFIGIFMLCLLCPGKISAQKDSLEFKTIPLKLNNESLHAALREIVELFMKYHPSVKLRIRYDDDDLLEIYSQLKNSPRITCNRAKVILDTALAICLKSQPFSYIRVDYLINISLKDVTGKVMHENGRSIPGVTVALKGTEKMTITDEKGEFILPKAILDSVIVFTYVGKETVEERINQQSVIVVKLKDKIKELDEVVINTGYQKPSKNKIAISADKLDSEAVSRPVSYSIIDRLNGRVPGVLIMKNILPNTNVPSLMVRGLSTIFANAMPLIVVDNFPFYGDINSINPNDVESVTVLKDAAATAVYGVLSGNGVIVITTKRGRQSQKSQWTANINSGFSSKPDMKYLPQLSPSDIIDVEKYLFETGYYDGAIDARNVPLSPVIEILLKVRKGELSDADGKQMINSLRTQDIRDDYEKYFHQNGSRQQYSLNLSGGNNTTRYYISGGYDVNKSGQQRTWDDRKTASITLDLNPKKSIEIYATANFTNISIHNPQSFPKVAHRYGRLYDAIGLPQVAVADIPQQLKDSLAQNKIDWGYRPVEEFYQRNNKLTGNHFRGAIGAKFYFLNKQLWLSLDYQLNMEFLNQKDLHSRQSYYSRNLQYSFADTTPVGLKPRIAEGGIYDWMKRDFYSNNLRAQVNFQYGNSKSFTIKSIGGVEGLSLKTDYRDGRDYGIGGSLTGFPVNFNEKFPLSYDTSNKQYIPGRPTNKTTSDNYLSAYNENTLTYRGRYIFSLSGRIDASNKFGVRTNQQKIVLWSTSLGWLISEENFYRLPWLNFLKLRASLGYNGNVDNKMSSQVVAIDNEPNRYNAISSSIISPQNDQLRWEKVGQFNVGIDFGTKTSGPKTKKIEGSIEFYKKFADHLIGEAYPDPTGLYIPYKTNSAKLGSYGFDFSLSATLTSRRFEWKMDLTASHNVDRVRKYDVPGTQAWAFTDPVNKSVRAGWAVHPIVAYPYAGLDSNTGNPQGYLNGQISTDYAALKRTSPDSLQYIDHANPTLFGGLLNSFRWGRFGLSFLITGKGGYSFRKYINHTDDAAFLMGMYPEDYAQRWQKQGDESKTSVLSLRHPEDPSRYAFYAGSTATIEKGDHLRLQDIRLSYDLSHFTSRLRIAKTAIFYLYINNPGILYKATRAKIDPDALYGMPQARSINFGVHLVF